MCTWMPELVRQPGRDEGGSSAVPGGQRKAGTLAGLCRAVIHFSTPTLIHSYTVVGLRVMQIVHRSMHRSSRWLRRLA
jgi:hypothetical protein